MSITEVPNVERDTLIASIENIKRTLPLLLEYNKIDAQIRRSKYLALIENGFNEQQALELCRS